MHDQAEVLARPLRRSHVRGKQIAIVAVVALVVVVAYDAAKARGRVPGMR